MESNGAIIYLTSKVSFVVSFIEPKFLEILQFCGYGVLVNFYVFAFLYYSFFLCVCMCAFPILHGFRYSYRHQSKTDPSKKTLRPGSSVLAAFTLLRECCNRCLCFWWFFFFCSRKSLAQSLYYRADPNSNLALV